MRSFDVIFEFVFGVTLVTIDGIDLVGFAIGAVDTIGSVDSEAMVDTDVGDTVEHVLEVGKENLSSFPTLFVETSTSVGLGLKIYY